MSNLASGVLLDDRFRLLEPLGAGGQGTVWSASDGRRKLAIKLLDPARTTTSASVDSLVREAEVLSALDHPNIPKVVAVNSSASQPYIAMELATGVRLDHELGKRSREQRPFTTAELLRIAQELLATVAYAHECGVVHRDLKPANVIVLWRGPWTFLKVLDFGVAKLIDTPAAKNTTVGRVIGSQFYISPEQARGMPVDLRVDLFTIATVLFEAITLHRAWARREGGRPLPWHVSPHQSDANTFERSVDRLIAGPRPRASELMPHVSPALDDFFMRALACDASHRHSSALEMLASFMTAARASDSTPYCPVSSTMPGTLALEK